ncbi:conserved Plasmodium protein, unknown function [Plasmodium malariae]|uniref:Telomere length regulation protein conserved domain-containing protein n=1 Tax=Plasmodium malariae TaxID=5858 RepID=A0A1C3KBB0_PLAMA|nr:conserved Plasmodium protein, unknown function [Plasmodium malariae]
MSNISKKKKKREKAEAEELYVNSGKINNKGAKRIIHTAQIQLHTYCNFSRSNNMGIRLEEMIKDNAHHDIENLLNNFFVAHIPVSFEIVRLKRKKRYKEALRQLQRNKYILINECFFVLSNLISAILKGILKIENVKKVRRYYFIYVWFIPFFISRRNERVIKELEKENICSKTNDNSHTEANEKDREVAPYRRKRNTPFYGVYLSEWIIAGLNKIMHSMILEDDHIFIENWAFILDLMKFIYVDKNILRKYFLKNSSLSDTYEDNDSSKERSDKGISSDRGVCDKKLKHDEKDSKNAIVVHDNFHKTMEKYYEDVSKVTKAYFVFPHLLFKCITKGLKKDDEKRKLQIYNYIIPHELNDKNFYKNAVEVCIFSWLNIKEGRVNYEKIVYFTKKIINIDLRDYFCQTLLYVLLTSENHVDCSKKEKLDIKMSQLITLNNGVTSDYGITPNEAHTTRLNENFINKEKAKTDALCNINYVIENIFYYLHLYCSDTHEGKTLLSCLMKNICPFIKFFEEKEKISLCLYNEHVNYMLIVLINIIFLYGWNFFFLEKFFNVFSKSCLPLSFAISLVEVVSQLFSRKSFHSILFKNFKWKKKKIIDSVEVLNEKRSYAEALEDMERSEGVVGESEKDANTLDECRIEVVAINFLREMLFHTLDQFTNDIQENEKRIFISIILSKLLYIFSVNIRKINKKIAHNLYIFDILSERELYIYKMNRYNVKIFESVTYIIHCLFNCNDELSLYCGQVIAHYFKHYVDNQSLKKEEEKISFEGKKKVKNKINTSDRSENSTDDEKYLFPNLEQPIQCLPKKIRHFKVIKQNHFSYLQDLLRMNDVMRRCKIKGNHFKKSINILPVVVGPGNSYRNELVEKNHILSEYLPGVVGPGNSYRNELGEKNHILSDYFTTMCKRGEGSNDEELEENELSPCRSEDQTKESIGEANGGDNGSNGSDEEAKASYDRTRNKGPGSTSLKKYGTKEKRKRNENDMMIKNAKYVIDNELYDLEEKEFLVQLEQENEFYLNIESNRYMYVDPSEDLFECLERLKNRASYIERNIDEKNYDILKLNEKKESYEEENFRICQVVVLLPRLIKQGDILSYIGVELFEVLLSLNNNSCMINKDKISFIAIKLFDMVLLSINIPVQISNFVLKNIYSNMYSSDQKMLMLLSLQLSALFLSNSFRMHSIFECVQNFARNLGISTSMMKNRKILQHQVEVNAEDQVKEIDKSKEDANDQYNDKSNGEAEYNFLNFSEKCYNLFDDFTKKINNYANNDDGDTTISLRGPYEDNNKREENACQEMKQNCSTTNFADDEGGNSCYYTKHENSSFSSEKQYEVEKIKKNYKMVKKGITNTKILQSRNYSYTNKKKAQIFLNFCSNFFSDVYAKLFCLTIKKEMTNIDYDEYRLRKYYSNDSSLTLFLISSYTLFFNCSCNSYLQVDDILNDGFSIGNFFIRNKNFLVRRASFKLVFHMIHLILKKKKFYILKNENYMNVINYLSNNVEMEHDALSLRYINHVLGVHETLMVGTEY